MNIAQFAFIVVSICLGLVVPWVGVGMFFMGLAVGTFLSVVLSKFK